MNKTLLLKDVTTMRKCSICKSYITLETELEDIAYQGKLLSHVSCMKDKMRKKKNSKLTFEDVEILVSDIKSESKLRIENIIYKNHLYQYLMRHYNVILIPVYIYQKMEQMFSGEFKGMSKKLLPEHLLDMFQKKASFLDNIRHKNRIDGTGRINYDLAVLISKYNGYLEWLDKMKNEEIKVEGYTIQNGGVGLTTMIQKKEMEKSEEDIFEE